MRTLKLTEETKKELLGNLLNRNPGSYGEYEDTVNGIIIKPNETGQIVIPEGAVVVPGTRTIKSDFDVELAIETPIIKKYGSKVELEDLLRP